jgi:uncharacterized protein YggE
MRKHSLKVLSLLVAVVAVLSIVALPVGAQDGVRVGNPVNSISVSGSGEASGTPDVAYINLGTDTVAADVGEAVEQANADMAAIIAAITDTGVAPEDIQTLNFNVWPEDRYGPDGQPTGERVYHVNNSLNVTVRDIDQVSTVIDAGLSAGADSVNGLTFGIDDTSDLEQEARLAAVEDARQRAEQLAAAFGKTVGEPIVISEVSGAFNQPPIPYAVDARALGGGGPQITPGQLQVTVQINVTFALGD